MVRDLLGDTLELRGAGDVAAPSPSRNSSETIDVPPQSFS
jgi:hypothetical protein